MDTCLWGEIFGKLIYIFDGCKLIVFFDKHRVESSDRQSQRSSPRQQDGFQVHVAISSSFTSSQIIKPTEVLLRKYFIRYGHILDVQVNYYNIHPVSPCNA